MDVMSSIPNGAGFCCPDRLRGALVSSLTGARSLLQLFLWYYLLLSDIISVRLFQISEGDNI